ncbi:hypothetical protein PHJA_001688800 [Phtheirospermum japonicum]|uniref:F-box associated beta-propeller type 3 domain-containing protein n=1 Tax=Phtheirospermum japonicum TaxID=374723 RepID=A0A830CK30_9LAMI|nr:hypothetical protein PHJA_001688800 [Phtheirospermum japonicum]
MSAEYGAGGLVGVDVYSVNSDTWTKIEPGFQFHMIETNSDGAVNGNPYWDAVVEKNESAKIFDGVYFDVSEMVFKTVPRTNFYRKGHRLNYVDWNGTIGVLMYTKDEEEMKVNSVEVWVFDEGALLQKQDTKAPD